MRRVNASLPNAKLAACALLACCSLISISALAQDACVSDDECMDELVCSRVLFGSDCESGECLDVLEQGFCSEPDPEPLRCDDDGQCPQPLYCDDANPAGPICGYVELMCSTNDNECPDGFMCVDLEPLGGCTVCEDDQECMSLPCAENMLNVCSPIAAACEEDSDCEEGFVCREIGPFDLQTGWDETLVGTKACLSVGLLAVADGFVQGGGAFVPPTGGTGGEPTAGTGDGGASGEGAGSAGVGGSASGGTNGGAGVGGASGMSTGGASGASAPMNNSGGDSGGCNVREPESSRAPALTILLALLIAALLLRRWPVG